MSSMSSLGAAVMSDAERNKYRTIYQNQNPTPNGIPAETAKNLFSKSRLPNDQLAQIW